MFSEKYAFKFIRCDNGTEYTGNATTCILDKFNIELQTAEPYTHEHNGTIERLNRTLEERIRALLISSGFPLSFWGLATHCATYLYNRTPHSALNFITPFEKAYDKQPEEKYIKNLVQDLMYEMKSYQNDTNLSPDPILCIS